MIRVQSSQAPHQVAPTQASEANAGDEASPPEAARRLRVCHLAKFYPPAAGGIESHLQTLARAQRELGAAVRVVCVNHRDRAGLDVTWKSLAWTPTVQEHDGGVEVLRLGRRMSLFRFDVCPGLLSLGRLVREWRADVVHLHTPNPTMMLGLVAGGLRVPVAISHHSDVVRQKKLGLVLRPFERRAYGAATAVLAASHQYAESSPLLREHAGKVRVVPYGIDLRPFLAPSPAALRFAQGLRQLHRGPIWLCVGRLVYYKGLATGLEALPGVPGQLLIVGEGPLGAALDRQVRRLGLTERVVRLGRVNNDELVGAYHAATALWFPSNARSEAFGLTQVEAMASGCPVINTDIPGSGAGWVSLHEESGLTVPVGDAAALARAARRLLDEPGLRQRLADGARSRACREFEAERMARQTLEVYRTVGALEARRG
jgi:rhamnosyl/mannosyltransferase